jgi:glutamine synthetase
MPFTENRFEFRMPGADSSQFLPLAVLFASTGDVLDEITQKLKPALEGAKEGDREEIIRGALRDMMQEAAPVIFEGDAYSAAWREEAKRRGLPEAKDAATAYSSFGAKETQELLERRGVMSERELSAFFDFKMDDYAQRVAIEADVMLEMVRTGIRPAAVTEQSQLAARVASMESAQSKGLDKAKSDLAELDALLASLDSAMKAVASSRSGLDEIEDSSKRAQSASKETAPAMDALRAAVDALEQHLPKGAYPYPTTSELLTARS